VADIYPRPDIHTHVVRDVGEIIRRQVQLGLSNGTCHTYFSTKILPILTIPSSPQTAYASRGVIQPVRYYYPPLE
jgi:hypothetical protein